MTISKAQAKTINQTLDWTMSQIRQLLERYDMIARADQRHGTIYASGANALAAELAARIRNHYTKGNSHGI